MKKNYHTSSILVLICLVFTISSLGAQNTLKPTVRLMLNTTNFNDETVFYFEQGGTTEFQPAFDAYKLFSESQPYIGSMSDSILTSISGLPALPVNLNIAVKAITPSTGSFTFSAVPENFPKGICVTLYDAFTNLSTSILNSTYVCTLYDTTSIARFTIHFFTSTLAITSSVKQADCQYTNGMIVAKGAGAFDFEWRDTSGIIKTSLHKINADTLPDLNGGTYTLNVNEAGGCGNFSTVFTMEHVITPTASFSPDVSTNVISRKQMVYFINNSEGAYYSSWDFGDKSGTWYLTNPSHSYEAAGTYTVTLIAESIHHCTDETRKIITVVDDLTGINAFSRSSEISEIKLSALSQDIYAIHFTEGFPENYTITVSGLDGKSIQSHGMDGGAVATQTIDLSSASAGMYILTISDGSKPVKTFKLVK